MRQDDFDIIDGDNIISRLNSTFDERNGIPYRQASEGYNVEPAKYKVRFDDRSERYIPAMFATCGIEQGAELRWNYSYDDKEVEKQIGRDGSAPGG